MEWGGRVAGGGIESSIVDKAVQSDSDRAVNITPYQTKARKNKYWKI